MKTMTPAYTEKFMSHNPTQLLQQLNSNKQVCTFYEHPTKGDEAAVYVMIGEVLADTGFFDTDDFYFESDYEPTLIDGQIMCLFETNSTKRV